MKEAISLALKAMTKTMDTPTLGSERRELSGLESRVGIRTHLRRIVEFAVLTLGPDKQPKAKIYKPAEIDTLLRSEGLAKVDEDTVMRGA